MGDRLTCSPAKDRSLGSKAIRFCRAVAREANSKQGTSYLSAVFRSVGAYTTSGNPSWLTKMKADHVFCSAAKHLPRIISKMRFPPIVFYGMKTKAINSESFMRFARINVYRSL